MQKYVCVCGYVYDPEVGDPDGGVAPGTPFEESPEDWVCPVCGVGKDMFEPENQLYLIGLPSSFHQRQIYISKFL